MHGIWSQAKAHLAGDAGHSDESSEPRSSSKRSKHSTDLAASESMESMSPWRTRVSDIHFGPQQPASSSALKTICSRRKIVNLGWSFGMVRKHRANRSHAACYAKCRFTTLCLRTEGEREEICLC